jgi:hypothetical protein
MRFPFTFMGLLSVAFGTWIAGYFAVHHSSDPVVEASGWGAAALMLVFGGYVLARRLRHGSQG